ncbi:hypothetical protein SAMN04515671_2442 [Nakamurella panacisegetis]|uniref:Uncharacterized protein n=1 Tax=Nakamurella panacisegetis TaxID=1090615 RepID=A0A1H0NQ44_9ACTN|nr:hypothetical protein SAMN04515671_2442 [Nakamurella panacisegetis]
MRPAPPRRGRAAAPEGGAESVSLAVTVDKLDSR